MHKDSFVEEQSQSYGSHSQRVQNQSLRVHQDHQKIQSFHQAFDRLKRFVDEMKQAYLPQNDELEQYLHKLHKHQNQGVNVEISNEELVKLVEERTERMVKNQKLRKSWSNDDKRILNWVVIGLAKLKKYPNIQKQFAQQDWNTVASLIPGATAKGCMLKWLSLHKSHLNEPIWSQREIQLLKSLVGKYVSANKSIRWKDVCKKLENAVPKFRTPNQCKQYWNYKLNSNLKRQPWTQEEDIILFKTVKQNSGIKKWVDMVKCFNGRTQNAVKNRYNLIIEKQKKYVQSQKEEIQLVQAYLQRCFIQKYTKIVEPDSVQEQKNSHWQKLENKQTRKSRKTKEQQQIQLIKQQNHDINLNIMTETKINGITQKLCVLKINKINQQNTSSQEKQENQIHPEQLILMQKIPQLNNNYNHRANDIEFNFMYIDHSE